MDSSQLRERLTKLSYRIVPLCETLPDKKVKIIEDQLIRSAFSAAANYRAACKEQSSKAFTSKLSIAFEEADETLFWLEVIADLNLIRISKLQDILKETDELTRILAASRKTSQLKILNRQS